MKDKEERVTDRNVGETIFSGALYTREIFWEVDIFYSII